MRNKWMWMLVVVGALAIAEEPRRGPKGGSVGNSGGELIGLLRRIATTRVKWAFDHEKNGKLLTDEERKAVKKVIEAGLPFLVVDAGALDVKRYEDVEGSFADVQPEVITAAGRKVRARLLDVEGDVCDARVVWDKETKTHVIQWDEISLNQSTQNGARLSDTLVRDVAHEVLRYAYHTHAIERNDDLHKISSELFVPPADEALPLPSREYRYDFKRRGKEIGDRARELIQLLKTDCAPHSTAARISRGYEEDLVILNGMVEGKELIHQLEGPAGIERSAENLDAVERQMILQRQTLMNQINLGHRHVEKPAKLQRHDLPTRSKYLAELCLRNLEMIQWHTSLRNSDEGKKVKASIDSVSGMLGGFRRSDWPKDDEAAARLFDGWEKYLQANLESFRARYPARD